MHMPGHKRNAELYDSGGLPYNIDITEIHGFDNLQNPRGALRETAGLAAELYGSDRAFLLVNGSTAGILAGIGASAKRGDTILMARGCHMSVYNAAALFGLKSAYIIPGSDEMSGITCSVSADAVVRGLDGNPGTSLVVITSPTYEGVISDISAIADAAHSRGALLLVDSAHGAHLGFSDSFPSGAVKSGADIVVMSLHKTLPAMTQCALLHVCGSRADVREITRLLSLFQTSSPSYVLMASIDRCLRMLKNDGGSLFYDYAQNLVRFDERMTQLKNLSVLCHGTDSAANHPEFFAFDPGKLVVSTVNTALTGTALANTLRMEHKIELETACADYALAMTSISDTTEGFTRLANALTALDSAAKPDLTRKAAARPPLPRRAMLPQDALNVHTGRHVPFGSAVGKISLEYVWAYPPGLPVIVPGEIISSEIVDYIAHLADSGADILSTCGQLPQNIYVSD